jgi:hypothetical protein
MRRYPAFFGRAGQITTVLSENGVTKATVRMETTADSIETRGGFYQLWIGLEEKYNECPTYGWTYSNLKIEGEQAPKTLRVNAKNPRYFDNGFGRAIVLSGVNHGWELQDNGWSTPYTLDWDGFLDYLESYQLNYIRLWKTESTIGREKTDQLTTPMPYERTGPGMAIDGERKFDLDRFNQAYFDRMRKRCIDARKRGMYVCVMLFEKHSTFNQKSDDGREYPWKAHPFHPSNNISGVSPDINKDGTPQEIHHIPEENQDAKSIIQARRTLFYQEAYIRKVVDTLNDLDNVIFEVCNEALPDDATDRWQIYLANYFKNYESTKPFQHLIGFTGPAKYHIDDPWPDMEEQKIDAVDFVSPREVDLYRTDPPVNDGRKIVFADSDHINPYGRDNIWAWKSFTRGLHPQALESYGIIPENLPRIDFKRDRLVRVALGQCLDYAKKIDLVSMLPRPDLSSTPFCLANPDNEYLVFSPDGSSFTVELGGNTEAYQVEWLNIESGEVTEPATVTSESLNPPFSGPAVAYLKRY